MENVIQQETVLKKVVYRWDGPMDDEQLNNFITFYNDLYTEAKNVDLTFYFSTVGGGEEVYTVLKDMLENSDMKITVVGHTDLSSFGFYLFYDLNVDKVLKPYTNGVIHTISIHLVERDLLHNNSRLKSNFKTLKRHNERISKIIEGSSLSDKKKKAFKKGKDVHLNSKEVEALMKSSPFGNLIKR